MSQRILIEAVGGLTSAFLIEKVQRAGHICIGSDIHTNSAGAHLCDEFISFPSSQEPQLWTKVEQAVVDNNITVVLPSLDEMMQGWADRTQALARKGIIVIISPPQTIATFQDKWLTYEFFKSIGIPTPRTSCEPEYSLVKPRYGRGGRGIWDRRTPSAASMIFLDSDISQELAFGQEYTVDCLFDKAGRPVYIIPRTRGAVRDGKSTCGQVVKLPRVEHYIKKAARHIHFCGPINFQCFVNDEEIQFIEVNPRIAGGMALGFAASENWLTPLVKHYCAGEPLIASHPVHYGLKMYRYYREFYV